MMNANLGAYIIFLISAALNISVFLISQSQGSLPHPPFALGYPARKLNHKWDPFSILVLSPRHQWAQMEHNILREMETF